MRKMTVSNIQLTENSERIHSLQYTAACYMFGRTQWRKMTLESLHSSVKLTFQTMFLHLEFKSVFCPKIIFKFHWNLTSLAKIVSDINNYDYKPDNELWTALELSWALLILVGSNFSCSISPDQLLSIILIKAFLFFIKKTLVKKWILVKLNENLNNSIIV